MQTTTISFFRYKGFSNRTWGMSMMYKVRKPLRSNPGVAFFKPLGTGSGAGYSIYPDFGVYGLLIVWHTQEQAEAFFESKLFDDYKSHSEEQYTIFLSPIRSKGSWSGFSDWQISQNENGSPLVAALTRATLKPGFVVPFWKMTPRVSREHENYKGLVFSKGVGEIPLLEQATFTIWKSVSDMEAFAYNTFHGEAIRRTRERDGFSEQMFTRFRPLKAFGSWEGRNPVQELLEMT
jgi:heme-degrading monooxygenase HmoA